jgi:PAS domain S-box-containing protein
VGAVILTLFDPRAGVPFALLATLPLALRMGLQPAPMAVATVVAWVMAVLLMLMLAMAALQARRARRTLAASRLAEAERARGAQEAESLLRLIFDHAGQGISVFDSALRLRAWNAQAMAFAGLDPAQVQVGLPMRDLLVKLGRRGLFGEVDAETEACRQLEGLAHAGSGPSSTAQLVTPDGRHVELRRNRLPDGGFVMFQADITEREASQAALAAQQRMRTLVLEATEQGFWYIDNELRTTDANPAMCRMLGVSRAQMMGRGIYDFVDEDNAEIFRAHVRLRAAGQAEGYEIALRRSDGSLVHCFNNATPVLDEQERKVGALGLFSDISAQKRAEAQVRQAGELLAQKSHVLEVTLDSLAQGVLSVDASGHCNAWNRRFLELLQLPESLMLTRPTISDLRRCQLEHGHFGEQLERLGDAGRSSLQRFMRGADDALADRHQRTRADGRVLEIVSHFAPDGSMVRTYTDITERQAAEAALIAARDEAEKAREEAERANRAKSDFLSRMSHELRTPMNAILGFGQLLEADRADPLSPGQARRVQALLRGGNHLLVLINEVLDIARIEAGTLQLTLQPMDVVALARDAMDLVQPVAQARGVVLMLNDAPAASAAMGAAGGPCMALADPTRLRQVVLNLLSNAIKFNRTAGQVRMVCRATPQAVWLEVADQGPGIAPDQLPKLFQAFERLDVDGAIEGAGIGLALSRSLMGLMHGEIGVNSTVGEGSVFWLRLPGAGAADAPTSNDDALAVPGAQAPRHDVLYVEDNEVNQLLMAGMLGHRPAIGLRIASHGEEGLAMAAARPPDLVLLDIQLPDIDGFEVLRRLRDLPGLRHTPVIAVSANAMPSDLDEARRAGFADYLTKPLAMKSLLAAVDAHLARRA